MLRIRRLWRVGGWVSGFVVWGERECGLRMGRYVKNKKNLRLLSRRISSTSWSLLISSLFRLFLDLQGLPSRPSRTFFGRPLCCCCSSSSSTSSPCNFRLARSVSASLRLRASSPRSISISWPCSALFCCSGLGTAVTVAVAVAGCCCPRLDERAAGWEESATALCRLASSASIYSSLAPSAAAQRSRGCAPWGG